MKISLSTNEQALMLALRGVAAALPCPSCGGNLFDPSPGCFVRREEADEQEGREASPRRKSGSATLGIACGHCGFVAYRTTKRLRRG